MVVGANVHRKNLFQRELSNYDPHIASWQIGNTSNYLIYLYVKSAESIKSDEIKGMLVRAVINLSNY
jgi:hypothetical protein